MEVECGVVMKMLSSLEPGLYSSLMEQYSKQLEDSTGELASSFNKVSRVDEL